MSKSQTAKLNYGARMQRRIRRDRAASLIMAAYIERLNLYPNPAGGNLPATDLKDIEACAGLAVQAADLLIAELDRTAPTDTNVDERTSQ